MTNRRKSAILTKLSRETERENSLKKPEKVLDKVFRLC